MKNKLIILFLILVLLVIITVMVLDFFRMETHQQNPYAYSLNDLDKVDTTLVSHTEVHQITSDIEHYMGIALDEDDQLYATGDLKINIFSPAFNLIKSFPIENEAYCISIGHDRKIYLGMQGHVEVWDTSGQKLSQWEYISESSIFTSIAVATSDVFIADAGLKIVHHFSMDGEKLNEIGAKDSLRGIPGFLIRSPFFDLLIGQYGELWVANPGLYGLEEYDFNGNLKSSWYSASMSIDGFCGCCNPTHIAMLSDGSFVTSEKGVPRVKVIRPSGEFKSIVAGASMFDEDTKDIDIGINSKDQIYIMDPFRKMIRIFNTKD